jgi:lipopolysaccharide export system protein LptA
MIARALALLIVLTPALAAAQALNLGSGGSGQPIEITARQGIEWDRDAQRYVATGDALARQGDTTVRADRLVAWYRQAATGGTEIFRYEAQGNVRIASTTQTVFGDRGIFDVDTDTMVVTGRALRLVTPTDTITARDSLEYHGQREIAVARGNAMVVSGDRRMAADVMTAYFGPPTQSPRPQAQPRGQQRQQPARAQPTQANAPENQRLKRVESFGNVHVSTPTEIARGDRGVYNMETSIAQLAGNVRLTRGDNQLAGDFAEVNNNTGISRLLSRPVEGGDGRVRGLFVPQQAQQQPQQQQRPGAPQR